ncbi:uncharacterized protein LOC125371330 [Ricinus communis]|uniref:uncharacterized protein LOC125371330 n=1 Tax=Ricinus communis TaxID=3988 RepID=UPI00201B29CE|nr:uncharacterized protein LOC125371330 [Ricinus communis]
MLDLRASINLIPYSIYAQLGLGELKPTTMSLQLADRSIKYPRGIIDDLLIQVGKLIIPCNFVVLDMKNTLRRDKKQTILFGRPFIATTKIVINEHNGKLTMTVLGETVEFKVFDSLILSPSTLIDECSYVDCMDYFVYETYLQDKDDKLEVALILEKIEENLDEEVLDFHDKLDEAIPMSLDENTIKSLDSPIRKELEIINEPPKLELKELPNMLKYVFLGEGNIYLVIVAFDLSHSKEEATIR